MKEIRYADFLDERNPNRPIIKNGHKLGKSLRAAGISRSSFEKSGIFKETSEGFLLIVGDFNIPVNAKFNDNTLTIL